MSIDSSQVALAITPMPAADGPQQRGKPKDNSPTSASILPPAIHGALAGMPQARQLEVSSSFGQAHLVVYRIVDKQTGDLIQQIPPEQAIEAVRRLQSLQTNESASKSVDIES
jgi:hypothetical protein